MSGPAGRQGTEAERAGLGLGAELLSQRERELKVPEPRWAPEPRLRLFSALFWENVSFITQVPGFSWPPAAARMNFPVLLFRGGCFSPSPQCTRITAAGDAVLGVSSASEPHQRGVLCLSLSLAPGRVVLFTQNVLCKLILCFLCIIKRQETFLGMLGETGNERWGENSCCWCSHFLWTPGPSLLPR